MTRALQRRLQKLESQVPRQPTEQEKIDLGDPTPEEAPIDGYMRALGYPTSHEFRKAWDANDPDLNERDRLAKIKLWAKFDVIWGEHEWVEIVEAVKRMEAGLPEQYMRCWHEMANLSVHEAS